MARYEVKAWIEVEAPSEQAAEKKAADLLDELSERATTSIDGVYELEEDD